MAEGATSAKFARAAVGERGKPDESIDHFGRLVRYEIRGLFGRYDHDIELEDEEPTILTGANGTGKSTILRTINTISSGSWASLLDMPLKSVTLRFENAPLVRATRAKEALRVQHARGDFTLEPPEDQRRLRQERIHLARLRHELAAEPPEVSEHAGDLGPYFLAASQALEDDDVPHWALQRNMSSAFPVRFITDQRLVIHGDAPRRIPGNDPRVRRRPGRRDEAVRDAVSHYATDLARHITSAYRTYAAASQREDRVLPRQVVDAMTSGEPVDLRALRKLVDTVNERRALFERVGLVEPEPAQFEQEVFEDRAVRPFVKTFAEATLNKFETIEPFRRKLQLFVDFLTDHFVGKRPVTSPERGLMFELDDGEALEPSDLSSGEQQILVLAYELLFATSPGTLLLVDEPEISLHVGWQSSFVDDITAMGADSGLQFLLATHSPVLLGGREDLKRSLDSASTR